MDCSGNSAILGFPLADVFCIDLTPLDATVTYEVYGTAYIIDDMNNNVFLYNDGLGRGSSIRGRGSLSLTGPHRPISAAKTFSSFLNLLQKKDGSEFIVGSYTWRVDNFTLYDKPLTIEVRGKLGVATISYTVLSVALQATISPLLREDWLSKSVSLYGDLVAYYEENYNCLASQDEKPRIVLFQKTVDKPAVVEPRQPFPMLRSCVTVPAYSSLKVELDLWYIDSSGCGKQLVKCGLDFPPYNFGPKTKAVGINSPLSLKVNWEHAKMSPFTGMAPVENYLFRSGYDILEIFSVRTFCNHSHDQTACEVYGFFSAFDSDCEELYKRDMKESEPLLPHNTLHLTGPSRCLLASQFGFSLQLHEKHQNMVLSEGFFANSPSREWKWFDRRVSAVIKGKDGYGVVHFTVFENAVQANVEVSLRSRGEGGTAVHGSLVAHYGNYDYSSDYVRKYFRTRLLDVPEEKPIILDLLGNDSKPAVHNLKVPLWRSAVTVPGNCPLFIEANLSCGTGVVGGIAKIFPQQCGTVEAHIGQADDGIDVKVSWFEDPRKSPGMPPIEYKIIRGGTDSRKKQKF